MLPGAAPVGAAIAAVGQTRRVWGRSADAAVLIPWPHPWLYPWLYLGTSKPFPWHASAAKDLMKTRLREVHMPQRISCYCVTKASRRRQSECLLAPDSESARISVVRRRSWVPAEGLQTCCAWAEIRPRGVLHPGHGRFASNLPLFSHRLALRGAKRHAGLPISRKPIAFVDLLFGHSLGEFVTDFCSVRYRFVSRCR